mmetsp:Transcript_6593/g.15763  ORF Transcript_6593/g.15763 Transcript_6593/m.15763 type:complete len:402 (-) Transcript_6593:2907-4112(-)
MEEPPPSDCPSSSGDGGPASAVPEANELLVAHHRRASSIVFGSCNSQHYDQPFWDVIRERNPTAFVWAGDAVYADDRMQSRQQRKRQPKPEPEGAEEQGPPKPQTPGTETPTTTTTTSKHKHATPEYLRLLYEEQKKVEGYRKLLLDDNHGAGERISVFGTIDDHDYGIDNGDETFEFRRENGMEFTRFLGLDDESSAVSRRAAKGRGVYGVQVYDFAPNRARRLLSDSEAGLDPDVVSEEAFREDERGDRRGSTATTDDDDDDDEHPAVLGWPEKYEALGGVVVEQPPGGTTARGPRIIRNGFDVHAATETELSDLDVKHWPTWTTGDKPKWDVGNLVADKEMPYGELSYMVTGKLEITATSSEGTTTVVVGAGDLVTFPRGFVASWKILEELTWHYYLY